jgi:hypothetical protein
LEKCQSISALLVGVSLRLASLYPVDECQDENSPVGDKTQRDIHLCVDKPSWKERYKYSIVNVDMKWLYRRLWCV